MGDESRTFSEMQFFKVNIIIFHDVDDSNTDATNRMKEVPSKKCDM